MDYVVPASVILSYVENTVIELVRVLINSTDLNKRI